MKHCVLEYRPAKHCRQPHKQPQASCLGQLTQYWLHRQYSQHHSTFQNTSI